MWRSNPSSKALWGAILTGLFSAVFKTACHFARRWSGRGPIGCMGRLPVIIESSTAISLCQWAAENDTFFEKWSVGLRVPCFDVARQKQATLTLRDLSSATAPGRDSHSHVQRPGKATRSDRLPTSAGGAAVVIIVVDVVNRSCLRGGQIGATSGYAVFANGLRPADLVVEASHAAHASVSAHAGDSAVVHV